MTSLLLAGLLAAQAAQAGTGIVTGVVRGVSGKPQEGVRVAAMAVQEDGGGAEVLVGIVGTDEAGRYRIEVPSGRYYIVAGRVDLPTFYPGTISRAGAMAITVSADKSNDGIDFSVASESVSSPPRPLSGRFIPSNPSELIAFLDGASFSTGPADFVFALESVKDRTVHFRGKAGAIEYGCPSCSFFVWDGGAAPQTEVPAILFSLSPDGQLLNFRCRAPRCHVLVVMSGSRIALSRLVENQPGSVRISDRVAFAIMP